MHISTRLCATAALLLAAFSASATQPLQGRNASFQAVAANDATAVYLYDPVFDITWLREARNVEMSWTEAKTWAEAVRGGLSGWRLPTLVDKGNDGCNYASSGTDCGYESDTSKATGSEMAHLYYDVLGNTRNGGLSNKGNFLKLESTGYWTGVSYAPNANKAWHFVTNGGFQYFNDKTGAFKALAVRDGDVLNAAAVPEPETFALLLAGLGIMAWRVRQRR